MDRGNHRGIAPTNHQIWIRMAFVLINYFALLLPPRSYAAALGNAGTYFILHPLGLHPLGLHLSSYPAELGLAQHP